MKSNVVCISKSGEEFCAFFFFSFLAADCFPCFFTAIQLLYHFSFCLDRGKKGTHDRNTFFFFLSLSSGGREGGNERERESLAFFFGEMGRREIELC